MKKLTYLCLTFALVFSACSSSKATTSTSKATSTSIKRTPVNKKPLKLKLVEFGKFDYPVAMVPWRNQFLVVEKGGRIILTSKNGKKDYVVLDINGQVSKSNEQGLLGLAVSPFDSSVIYVDYTDKEGNTAIEEYHWAASARSFAVPRRILSIDQPFANHNGGNIIFGPDKLLYIGMGDGGSAGDPANRAQNGNVLLGKILRIDPRAKSGKPYSIPKSNPYVNANSIRPEILSFGLRNPWRFSFDSKTKDMWIGDVGQDTWEEIDHVKTARGVNFGWSHYEGTHDFKTSRSAPNAKMPIFEYQHGNGECSVTGGFVYRGKVIPRLQGTYLYGDYCLGQIHGLKKSGGKSKSVDLGMNVPQLVSFAQGKSGELFALSGEGSISRIKSVN